MRVSALLVGVVTLLILASPASAQTQRVPVHPSCATAAAKNICSIAEYRTMDRSTRARKCLARRSYQWAPAYTVPETMRPWTAIVAKQQVVKSMFAGGHRCIPDTPVGLGKYLAAKRGWVGWEWTALYRLWNHESGWDPNQWNRGGSGACGIPQALPCSKMCSDLPLSSCSVLRQITWGLGYIAGRYTRPSAAYAHLLAANWY